MNQRNTLSAFALRPCLPPLSHAFSFREREREREIEAAYFDVERRLVCLRVCVCVLKYIRMSLGQIVRSSERERRKITPRAITVRV